MRDAVELEWAGIPAVAIVHQTMKGSAEAMALVSGMEGYPFLTVGYPHVPLAGWTPEEIGDAAGQVAAAVRRLLTAAGG